MSISRRSMKSPSLVAVALVLLLNLPVAPASAIARGELVVTGKGNTSAQLMLQKAVKLNAENVTAISDGSYAGVAIYSANGAEFFLGSFIIPTWAETGQPIGTLNYSKRSVHLKPGKYRVYLLSDAPSVVKIPILSGGSDKRIFTSRQEADATGGILDLGEVPVVQHGEGRVPLEIPPASDAFVAAAAVVEHHQAGMMEACVGERDTPDCHIGGDLPSMSVVIPSPGAIGPGYTLIYGAGSPKPGPMDVLVRMEGIGKADHLLAFYVVLPLADN